MWCLQKRRVSNFKSPVLTVASLCFTIQTLSISGHLVVLWFHITWAWAGLMKPGPSVLRVPSPWVPMEPSLCVPRHHCRAKPGSSPTSLSTPTLSPPPAQGNPLLHLHFSKPLCVFCQTLLLSGFKVKETQPENLAGFLFCTLPCSCPKAMNQRAGYLLWWGEKRGKHREEIYLN